MPSSLEGQPIALLEALSYGAPVLASDIPENRALPIQDGNFFPVGDSRGLALLLERASASQRASSDARRQLKETYSWRRAAQLTRSLYDRVVSARA